MLMSVVMSVMLAYVSHTVMATDLESPFVEYTYSINTVIITVVMS